MPADFQPDQIKIDMNLVRGIERHDPRQAIVRAAVQVCGDLGINVWVATMFVSGLARNMMAGGEESKVA